MMSQPSRCACFRPMVFFQSGRTKAEGLFTIKDSTWFLIREEWVTHGLKAAAFLAIMARGPGSWSLDQTLRLNGDRTTSAQYGLAGR